MHISCDGTDADRISSRPKGRSLTDCRSYWKDYRAGVIDVEEIWRVNNELVPTVGVSNLKLIVGNERTHFR